MNRAYCNHSLVGQSAVTKGSDWSESKEGNLECGRVDCREAIVKIKRHQGKKEWVSIERGLLDNFKSPVQLE
jgi:hypothetical protein